jgi:hypothetical protein
MFKPGQIALIVVIIVIAYIISQPVTYQKFKIFQIANSEGDCTGIIKICDNHTCVNANATLSSQNIEQTCDIDKASK